MRARTIIAAVAMGVGMLGVLAGRLSAQTPGVAAKAPPAAASAPAQPAAPIVASPPPPPPAAQPVAEIDTAPPKPKYLVPPKVETEYRAKVRAMLEPLLTRAETAETAKRLKEVLKDRSGASAATLGDPAARKIVQWQALKAGVGEPGDFMAFVAANPAWPD